MKFSRNGFPKFAPKKSLIGTLFGRYTLADAGQKAAPLAKELGPFGFVYRLGAIVLLLSTTVRMLLTAKTDRGDTIRVTHRFTNGSAAFIIISMAFVGMIMVYQSTIQLTRSIGDTQLVGASFLKLLVRLVGPVVVGLLIACRIGAGIAAEIGAMAVTDQLDALRMCSAEPVEVLMVPRLRGGILASLVLVLIGGAAAAFAGGLCVEILFGMSPSVYWNLDLIGFPDLFQGVFKALLFGISVPIVSGVCGLAAAGGARGVGQATTDAVVGSSFAIIALDSLVSFVFHVLLGQ